MRTPSSRGGEGGKKAAEATPCRTKTGLKRGPWTAEEDEVLINFIKKEGEGRWQKLPKKAGLLRCGKSCRLRWMNYLRPSVKRGHITPDEEDLILRLHRLLGNRWSLIAGRIPGRTDNEIKNYWNTHLSKKLISQGIDPKTHKPLYSSKPYINTDMMNKKCISDAAFENEIIKNSTVQHGVVLDTKSCVEDEDEDRSKKDLRAFGDEILSNCEDGDHHDTVVSCCADDDAFSLFLNSLFNDDMFNNQHQDQQQ